jgi:hypothetical protein
MTFIVCPMKTFFILSKRGGGYRGQEDYSDFIKMKKVEVWLARYC